MSKCVICGNKVKSRSGRNPKYCSRYCYTTDRRNNAERNPNYKDGSCITNYGSQVAYRKRSRHKRNVRDAVFRAIQSGKIKRLPCADCGNNKSEAHHNDYSKPLDVEWLCKKCHSKRHYHK